jgi:hypothetical protein
MVTSNALPTVGVDVAGVTEKNAGEASLIGVLTGLV